LAKQALSAVLNCASDWVQIAHQHDGLGWRDL